jgi:hypothetical protein
MTAIQPWITQVPDGIAISLWKHVNPDNATEVLYSVELNIFLEPFDDEPAEVEGEAQKKVLAMSTNIVGETYDEVLERALVSIFGLYEDTFVVPIVYVFELNEAGEGVEIDKIDMSGGLINYLDDDELAITKTKPGIKI